MLRIECLIGVLSSLEMVIVRLFDEIGILIVWSDVWGSCDLFDYILVMVKICFIDIDEMNV